MIFIIGSKNDPSIILTIKWLEKYNLSYLVLDGIEAQMNIVRNHLISKSQQVQNKIWVWKNQIISNVEPHDLLVFVNNEYQCFQNHIIRSVKRENRLGNFFEVMEIEKLHLLEIAENFGFKIPPSEIICNRLGLNRFLMNKGRIITKPLFNGRVINDSKRIGKIYTNSVLNTNKIPLKFQPSLVQEKISFQYEIRVIFLDGNVYCTAIFKDKSKVDIKQYSPEEIRCVPYELDIQTKIKVLKLFKFLDLNFGSLDLLYSKSLGYIFLEINPTGQFDLYSKICNFQIHNKIALWLKNQK